jgi:spermidine/putrescine transport system ATP-binding protein
VADVAVRLVQLTKRFGGDAQARRVAKSVEGANPDAGFMAVDHIDLEVRDGEFFSLLGPSGCGKTTTLRMIGGFEQPTEGTIELQGEDVTWLPAYRRNVNTVFQNYALFPHLTIFENVAFGLRRRKVSDADVKQRVGDMLELVELRGFDNRKPAQISGGQAQRVALARALVNKPAVLLLDEPLGALDLKLRKQMQIELKRIQQEVGITFIYVTHDQEEAMTMSDRIAVMNHGRYEQLGDPEVLYERPRTRFVAGFLGVSNLLPATPGGRENGYAGFRLGDGSVVRVPAALVDGKPEGKLALGVRPEKIRLIEPKDEVPGGLNRASGTISHASYLGVSTQYIVNLKDGHRVTVYEQNVQRATKAELWAPGEDVILAWSPEHCFVVEDSAVGSTDDVDAVAAAVA